VGRPKKGARHRRELKYISIRKKNDRGAAGAGVADRLHAPCELVVLPDVGVRKAASRPTPTIAATSPFY